MSAGSQAYPYEGHPLHHALFLRQHVVMCAMNIVRGEGWEAEVFRRIVTHVMDIVPGEGREAKGERSGALSGVACGMHIT